MNNYVSTIHLPAYDSSHVGLITEVTLTVLPCRKFGIYATGRLAAPLRNNFERIIEIMISLRQEWEHLGAAEYRLTDDTQYDVRDSKSSGMGLSIALINYHRFISGQNPISGFTGTGILRNDGSFDRAHYETGKWIAAKQQIPHLRKFVTPASCSHIFYLEDLIENFNNPGERYDYFC